MLFIKATTFNLIVQSDETPRLDPQNTSDVTQRHTRRKSHRLRVGCQGTVNAPRVKQVTAGDQGGRLRENP